MMQPESLVRLVGSGNRQKVEEEWLRIMESAEVPLPKLADYAVVLKELRQLERVAEAESLAWAAVESISARHAHAEALTVAGPFLLAVGNSSELRAQITALYRLAYADLDGLDMLLGESGIEGGRPVRRALRTLDVCLALKEGDFLSVRDDDGVATVEDIDRAKWEFTIAVPAEREPQRRSLETLDAVHLADQYRPAAPTDFEVMRLFARDELLKQLKRDPVAIVQGLCGRQNGKMDSNELESLLVPGLLSAGEWKKWWTRVRGLLKQHSNFELEGRAPYAITHRAEAVSPEDRLLADFGKLRDPLERWTLVEQYVRQCRTGKGRPSPEALHQCYDYFQERAGRATRGKDSRSLLLLVIAARIGELGGLDHAPDGVVKYFEASPDETVAVAALLEFELLVDITCRCIVQARPDVWADQLLALLPALPLVSCDEVSVRLFDAGKTRTDFESVVQQILASPIAHFEALLWLWGGPSREAEILTGVAPVTILVRILRALEDARRSEKVGRERIKQVSSRARAVLSARRYERFTLCLEGIEPGMAAALRTQLSRAEALGRAAREDMLRALDARFPVVDMEAEIPLWSQEDIIYVSRPGLLRKQAEIDEHLNVKMRDNARAIGRAAEHGDLSENSEYKFALEERDLLRARLAQMNDELARAKVITAEDVPTDHIGVGTKTVFERVSDGQRFEMSFLGPWEAGVQDDCMNYKAPLPQRLMGMRIGEVVELELSEATGEYKVVELHCALDE